jgi:agmatine deiminase
MKPKNASTSRPVSAARRAAPAAAPLATPFSLGYRMPAEWEPHAATWLAWPHEPTDWPGKFESVPWVFAEVIKNLTRGERVRLLVSGKRMLKEARQKLEKSQVDLAQVDFVEAATDRCEDVGNLLEGIVVKHG